MRQQLTASGLLAGVVACSMVTPAIGQTSRAFYRVEFETHWTEAVHGDAYVTGAHFSIPTGMIHSDDASLWRPGEIATPAIELMAEQGRAQSLRDEIDGYVNAGSASERLAGRGLQGEDFYAWNRWFSTEHHRLTIVSMIAPSPDWFTGTHNLSLIDQNGEWIEQLVIPLEAYDSGTDSGAAFIAANADTQPRELIRNIQNEAPFNGVPTVATITIILQSIEDCIADLNQDGMLSPADFNAWIQAYNDRSPAADQNGDGAVTPADFNGWILNFNAGC